MEVGTSWCLNVKFKMTKKFNLIDVLFATLKSTFFRQIIKQNYPEVNLYP